MQRGPLMRAVAAGATAALLAVPVASGYWSSPTAPGGAGAAKAGALPQVSIPSAGAVGPSVTVRWTPVTFTGATVGYELARYASSGGSPTGSPVVVPCTPAAGPGGTLECLETAPAGTWHYTVTATLNNWRGPESTPSPALDVFNDVTPPTTTATPSPATPASGWYRTTPVSIGLAAADNAGGSGVANVSYTLDGSDPRSSPTAIVYTSPVAVTSTTTIRFAALDRANNWEAPKTRAIQIDSAPPANNLSVTAISGGAYLSGSSLFYRGLLAGAFTITNAVSDTGGSGPASSATSALAGIATGWTHTAGTVSTPSGGPYVSSTFSWIAGTTTTPSTTLTAADGAGNTTTTAPLTLRLDNTAPTSAASPAPGPNAAGWNNTPVSVALGSADNAGGSGVAAIRFTTDGSNPATSPTAVVYSSPIAIASTTTIRFSAIDNVGNTEVAKTQTVRIDSTAPSSALTLSGVTGGAFLSGSTVFYRGVSAGSFTLTNAVADPGGSGAASSTTSPLGGTATGWTHTPSTVTTPGGGPFVSSPFAWTAGTTSSPTEVVTATDAAGNTAATTLNFVDDSAAPIVAPVFPAAPSYSTGSSWSAGCASAVADVCGNASDSGSGLASVSVVLTRASDGKCWNTGNHKFNPAGCSGQAPDAFTPGTSPAWSVDFPCAIDAYTLSVTVRDNVGNLTTAPQQSWQITNCTG